jgi:hypothetical protein
MLETIRQFAEEQLVADGAATQVRAAHARHFAVREADILALWDSPRQREAYAWFTAELANLRTAFRWAADHGDLDTSAVIASYATFLGFWVGQFEPAGWAEELIESAKAVDHRRLAQLYAMAAQCYAAGRIDDAVDFNAAAHLAIASGRFDQLPFEFEAMIGGTYIHRGEPERWADLCRNIIARDPGAHTVTRGCLVMANAHVDEEAVAAAEDLLIAANATDNPQVASFALLAYGFVRRSTDPVDAYHVLRRGLKIAQDSGNLWVETQIAINLSRLAATDGDPMDAFDFLTLAIRHYHYTGNVSLMHQPLAAVAALLDRLGHHEPAATISGFAATLLARMTLPEIKTTITHLREALGDQVYESLARAGQSMTNAAMAAYALDQIDQARAELNGISK